MSSSDPFLPVRVGETDDERRLREMIERTCGQMMGALDSAIRCRNLPEQGKRDRHQARAHLRDFAVHAMSAIAWRQQQAGLPQDAERG